MSLWKIVFLEEFDAEFRGYAEDVKDGIVRLAILLAAAGPELGRPHCDTLKGSKFRNMKELRFGADGGVWRVAFAFDPQRSAILLVAGDKSGVSGKRFYKNLIATADARFDRHLVQLEKG